MKAAAAALLVGLAVLLMVPAASFLYEAGAPDACARCHEMGSAVGEWRHSTHRGVACSACHGDALTADFRFHLTNARRLVQHWQGEADVKAALGPAAIRQMLARCRKCHEQEFASWSNGPHAIAYRSIFLDEKHNSTRHLMDDCLRCHAMHFQGGIRDLVEPLSTRGPWRLRRADLAEEPAIPCMTCHSIHRRGARHDDRRLEAKVPGPRQEIFRPSLAFFDRRSQAHVAVALLPLPAMLEKGRPVRMSPDPRQALCYQCHAPLSTREVFSGDDRTPVGVHEGISCLACHEKHRQTTRASCANCHPRLSNCGLDVEKMDTTFANRNSKHNIHTVKCADCHPRGVPARRERPVAAAD